MNLQTFNPVFFHRRSLGMALVTLPVSFALTFAFSPMVAAIGPIDEAVFIRSAVASFVALVLCCFAWLNLVRDVGRGYSPARCSLAALLLGAATVSPLLLLVLSLRQLLVAGTP